MTFSRQRTLKHGSSCPKRSTLFVHGVTCNTKARDLARLFEQYGSLVRCDIPAPKLAPVGKRLFAFVEFEKEEDANSAFKSLQGQTFEGYKLTIQWSKAAPSMQWHESTSYSTSIDHTTPYYDSDTNEQQLKWAQPHSPIIPHPPSFPIHHSSSSSSSPAYVSHYSSAFLRKSSSYYPRSHADNQRWAASEHRRPVSSEERPFLSLLRNNDHRFYSHMDSYPSEKELGRNGNHESHPHQTHRYNERERSKYFDRDQNLYTRRNHHYYYRHQQQQQQQQHHLRSQSRTPYDRTESLLNHHQQKTTTNYDPHYNNRTTMPYYEPIIQGYNTDIPPIFPVQTLTINSIPAPNPYMQDIMGRFITPTDEKQVDESTHSTITTTTTDNVNGAENGHGNSFRFSTDSPSAH